MKSRARGGIRRRGGPRNRTFVLQWHVTARCEENCNHCYARDSPDLRRQLDEELSLDSCFRILDSFSRFLKENKLPGRVNFTGGDPLLKDGHLDLIKRARELGLMVGIMGNPRHLDLETAIRLRKAGVFRYQVSIDGMEETHDRIRGRPGHFKDTLRAIRTLNKVGLPSVVMFTLSRENANELPSVAKLVSEKKVSIFDFSRLIPQGRGRDLEMLGPEEYRDILMRTLATYQWLVEGGSGTYFGRKEALWNLLYAELGLFEVPKWNGLMTTGCSIGSKVLTVLADGTVYPCRRVPIPIGRMPEDGFQEVFMGSKVHNVLRNVANLEKCRDCGLLPYCRGCPGVAFGSTGDPFSPDPQCWRAAGQVPLSVDITGKVFGLRDFALWSGKRTKECASCDGACGGCAIVCAACSEVCASCSGQGDI
jgi:radical SAM protein with 4Fe4S-binding SPASM domain